MSEMIRCLCKGPDSGLQNTEQTRIIPGCVHSEHTVVGLTPLLLQHTPGLMAYSSTKNAQHPGQTLLENQG